MTGLDAMAMFPDRRRQDAVQRGVTDDYVQGDMRSIPWSEDSDAQFGKFMSAVGGWR